MINYLKQVKAYFLLFFLLIVSVEVLSDAQLLINDESTLQGKNKQGQEREEKELKKWKLKEGVLEVELVSQPPESIKAFFIARGFSNEISKNISHHCVFQMIVHNRGITASDSSIHLSLKDWQIKYKNELKPIKLKEVWDEEWSEGSTLAEGSQLADGSALAEDSKLAEGSISQAARIAFRWATFPTQQVFEPTGDYAWGMVSIGLLPGEFFDLQIVWQQNNTTKKAWISNMQCPQ